MELHVTKLETDKIGTNNSDKGEREQKLFHNIRIIILQN